MDLETLKATLQHASLASLGVGFSAGFIFSFNPVALAAIPVSLAYVTKAHETKTGVLFGTMFILGLVFTHAAMGLIAGFGGLWVQKLLGREWGLMLGPLLIVLGLMWPGWIKLPLPALRIPARPASNAWGAFALGIPFSVAICPFCTPALVILLGVAAGIGSPLFGLILLMAFALGRSVPILLGAWAIAWLENLKALRHAQKIFEVLGALTLIASGLYMLNAYFYFIPSLAA